MTGSVWVFKAAGWWAVGGVFGSFREAASAVGRWGLSGDIHEVVADVLPHTWAVEQELVASDVPISVDDLRGVLGDHWASRTACEGVVHESPPVPPRGRESGESADLWVFQSRDLAWPAAVFSSQASARRCIAEAQLSGILTEYPCGVLPYERDTRAGLFKQPKKQVVDARYIGTFVSVDQDHEHFCDGWPSSILSGGAGRMEEFLPVRFDAVWEPARGRADAASLSPDPPTVISGGFSRRF